MENLFTREELTRIRSAIAGVEDRTSGEIVPYIVPASDSYDVAVWRGAAAGVLIAVLVALMIFQFYEGWGLAWLHEGWGTALLVLVAGMLGGLTARFIPPVKRLLVGTGGLAERVHDRAIKAFLEEEVFDTRNRTGILLFISLLEHRIEVIGDSGINRQVEDDDWIHIVERIQKGIRNDRLADGIIEAVEMCGRLLEKKGVDVHSDDFNELSDSVRLRDE
jgi:putative membrane protein